ncbi:hypothetical protein VP1G_09783 [Cytospora mali]|uniref:Uncharacterized protein n=1 Tax=Cytospora mali TaxID=578113 RepID=A0A194VFA1_CYTMA|nr:hypothetical protein VP1G_09783 [Valsa mali var. pyri (nom. inval.)]
MWSLGCMFLEFVTWILVGAKGLDAFGDQRHKDGGSRDSRFSVDNFFRNIKEEEQIRAQVKPSVLNVTFKPICMLLVDKEKRDNFNAVSTRLKKLFKKCQQNPSYALYRDAKEVDGITARAGLATT